MHPLFERHLPRLEAAVDACRTRGCWSPFVESPSRRFHPEGAKAEGLAWFESQLSQPFDLDLPGSTGRVGAEISPYTAEPLGVTYPEVQVEPLVAAMVQAMPTWVQAGPQTRVGLCMEMLDRMAAHVFHNAYATMHTGGQGFMTAFAGSGANSLDRGLEALAHAHIAMSAIPTESTFERSFGHGPVKLRKRYYLRPRGVAVVIACGSYPAWNAWPALFANLATGNPVVLKPHPMAILPVALGARICREVLAEAGFDPNLVTLAAEAPDGRIAQSLVGHRDVAIIDFTGSPRFGAWLEQNCRRDQLLYTETAGCNAVVLESVRDLEPALQAIAQSLCLFSGQMCTTAQNIFVPRSGVRMIDEEGGEQVVPFEEVAQQLVAAVDALVAEPAHAAGLCGALHSADTQRTLDLVQSRAADEDAVLRPWSPYDHPEHPSARTATPLVVQVPVGSELYRQEWFGPIGFVIPTADRDEALQRAAEDAAAHGSIAAYGYSVDDAFLDEIEQAYIEAGASIGLNLLGQRPINFAAAYSDYHVTGLNPAGTACLTDLAFVADRFRVVQCKREI
ncbi:MAG: phenylacetic acid degradation protein PaaN [Bradymonadia bacterium]